MRRGRILIVDDEFLVRSTLADVLSHEGYVVDEAGDGENALVAIRRARPDVILLDLMMRRMNGRQFLVALRGLPDLASVPVLIMTAVQGLNINLAQLGMSEIIQKPFDVEELLNKVALAAFRSRSQRPATVPPWPPPSRRTAGSRGVVLLFDADPSHLRALERALAERGFKVVAMQRPLVEMSRLVAALQPLAVLVERSLGELVTLLDARPAEAETPTPASIGPLMCSYDRDRVGLAHELGELVEGCAMRRLPMHDALPHSSSGQVPP